MSLWLRLYDFNSIFHGFFKKRYFGCNKIIECGNFIGFEVQSYRIRAFMCVALAHNGVLCQSWRVDSRYTCEQRLICHHSSQGIAMLSFSIQLEGYMDHFVSML